MAWQVERTRSKYPHVREPVHFAPFEDWLLDLRRAGTPFPRSPLAAYVLMHAWFYLLRPWRLPVLVWRIPRLSRNVFIRMRYRGSGERVYVEPDVCVFPFTDELERS